VVRLQIAPQHGEASHTAEGIVILKYEGSAFNNYQVCKEKADSSFLRMTICRMTKGYALPVWLISL
jgi:hypothetical protein